MNWKKRPVNSAGLKIFNLKECGFEMSVNSNEAEVSEGSGYLKLVFRLLPVALFLGLAGIFAVSLFSGDASVLPSALIDKPVPQFKLPGMGKAVAGNTAMPGLASEDLKQGKVTVVNYWASWCPPCRLEHPVLMHLSTLNKAELVGISQKDDPVKSQQFLKALGNPFTAMGVDRSGRVSIDWGVYGLPETFIIDGKGNIRFKYVGPISDDILATKILPEIEKAKRPISR